MLSWLREARSLASRSKRARRPGTPATRSGSTLIRHLPSEPLIAGAVDHTHAALAEQGEHAVVAEGLADELWHGCVFLLRP